MNKGFVALTLVITISSLLLAFSFMQSVDIAHFFDQTQTKQYRLMSYYSAYNCIDRAVLNLAHDYFYKVTESVEIPDLNCKISAIKRENGLVMIEVLGNYKKIEVKRSAIARLYDNVVEIISIQ